MTKILDTTIRDGSYAVNFNFSCTDVKNISTRLENLGFEFIEIGHGMGLNASSEKNGISLHSDEEYMLAANSVLTTSKFGNFCIPGIAKLDHLKQARDCGASFVRIGINADEIPKTEPFIREAKKLGFIVMTNYMKSYALTPSEFAQSVKLSEMYGADYVYIVDSAGSMLPETIKEYHDSIREKSDIKLGFHAHDNLGLAVYNSVYCAKLGFDIIDTSLQGLGRSSGNASTELTSLVLMRMGFDLPNFDVPSLLHAGYDTLSDVTSRDLRSPLDMVCGLAEFHTSYMSYIHRCSATYNVNPLLLIIEYTKIDKLNMDYDKLCELANNLPKNTINHSYNFSAYIGNEQALK